MLLANVAPITAPNASAHGAAWGVGRGDAYFNQLRCEIYDNTPTVVTTNPASATLPPGATHTFTASYTGCATNLQWHENNAAMSGENGHTLTLVNVTSNHVAAYKLGIADPQTGTTIFTASATLTIQPTISILLSDGNIAIHFTGTLQSSATMTGPFTNIASAPTSPIVLTNPAASAQFFRTRY